MDKKMLAIFVLSVLAILVIALPAAAWWGGWGWPWGGCGSPGGCALVCSRTMRSRRSGPRH